MFHLFEQKRWKAKLVPSNINNGLESYFFVVDHELLIEHLLFVIEPQFDKTNKMSVPSEDSFC